MSRRRPSGFTLIEVVVIMAVVGLLVGVVGPRIAATRRTYNLIEGTQQLAADLRRARAEALRLNTSVNFTRSTATTYTLSRTTGGTTLWTRQLPNGVTFTVSPDAAVTFTAFGPTIISGGASLATFTLTLDGATRTVTLGLNGQPTVR